MSVTDETETIDASGDAWEDRLSEYLDGELEPTERQALERHLAGCASCRQVLGELRVVVSRAAQLPRAVVPKHDLWAGIERGLHARAPWRIVPLAVRVAVPRLVPRLAFAAMLALACVALYFWLTRPQPPTVSMTTQPRDVAHAQPDRAYDDTVAELRREAHERLAADPQVVRVLESNLSALDRAIAEYRDTLAEQPGDVRLKHRLEEARRRKLEVLQHAAGNALEGTN